MPRSPQSEKALFWSVWAILLLFGAISYLGSSKNKSSPQEIEVLLSGSIKPWFHKAQVRKQGLNRYLLDLELTPEYRATLSGNGKRIHLGYALSGPKLDRVEGIAPLHVIFEKPITRISLPRPDGYQANLIELRLAD